MMAAKRNTEAGLHPPAPTSPPSPIYSLRQALARLEAVNLEAVLKQDDGHVHRHQLLGLWRHVVRCDAV